ncbi:hypothetical protein OTK49_26740 [Vibrio coralliirubri]|uniref:hypothetical protein n=1 Tax=Vibrio coralliirubri TaxID=1516159 RepID=UPI0022852403|nr:hypothetical protein [Vibrio coralliirubri]MCY9866139.1 hypothetical protein [Vibrio coralliirubri]
MTSSQEISLLRQKQKSVRKLTNEAYIALAEIKEPSKAKFSIDGLGIVASKIVNKAFKALSPDTYTIKELEIKFEERPTRLLATELLRHSRTLLAKKLNADAVRVLRSLTKRKIEDAIVSLGTIFMYGVKDRIGKTEFKHPQNAMKCLTLGVGCGNIEAGYLLGALFRSFGQNDKAKETFYQNIDRGCIKSVTEVIILLQVESAASTDARHRAIIEQKIRNLRTDLTYSSN